MQPSPNARDITVIGAGIIGTSCALELQRDGREVTLIDQAGPGEGCSYGNAGCISPAAVVPVSMPGMLKSIPKWLLDAEGPLTVRWRYFPKALPWLMRWIRAGQRDNVWKSSRALNDLNAGTLDGYRRLLSRAQFDDVIRLTGHLYVWRSDERSASERLGQSLRESHGIRTQWLKGDELREIEPAIGRDCTSALLLPDNGYTCNPERLVKTLVANFAEAGGRFMRRKVLGFEIGAQGATRIYTDCGSMPISTVVVAAGAYSLRLATPFGARIPLETERGYHIMLAQPTVKLRLPVMDVQRKFFATPMENGLRLAGTVEIGGLDAAPDYRRAETLLAHGKRLLPGLEAAGTSVWMGCRPSIPDSVPVIDRSSRFPSVFYAFGHGHLGMSGGPGTGRLIADLVAGRRPEIDPTAFRADRFHGT